METNFFFFKKYSYINPEIYVGTKCDLTDFLNFKAGDPWKDTEKSPNHILILHIFYKKLRDKFQFLKLELSLLY